MGSVRGSQFVEDLDKSKDRAVGGEIDGLKEKKGLWWRQLSP